MDRRIERILKGALGGKAAAARVAPLDGGITNRNYRVEAGGEAFVLRISGEGTSLLGIDRRNEHAAASTAAGLGVAPEVIHFNEAEGALLTRFLSGQAITPESAGRPEVLERIVRSIRRYHQGPPFRGAFSPFETVRAYHALAEKHAVCFPGGCRRALALMAEIESALAPLEEPVPCHNDLLAANFIDDGETIHILDWEYAGMGQRFFDLGNFAVNQRLPEETSRLLLRFYFGEVRPRDAARLHLWMLASDLREAWWGFLQSGISRLEFDFPGYGATHLERFLKSAGSPGFGRWLEEARGS